MNNLAKDYLNKGIALEKNNDSTGAVEMFNLAIEIWKYPVEETPEDLLNLINALCIRVRSSIKLENWHQVADDVSFSLLVFLHAPESDKLSDEFKEKIKESFNEMILQIRKFNYRDREIMLFYVNQNGEMQNPPQKLGDILREYIEQI